jgi:hypothetical protein
VQAKKGTIEPFYRPFRTAMASSADRFDGNLNAGRTPIMGLDSLEEAVDRISEASTLQILKLAMAKDRKEIRDKVKFSGPDVEITRLPFHFIFECLQPTVWIAGLDGCRYDPR